MCLRLTKSVSSSIDDVDVSQRRHTTIIGLSNVSMSNNDSSWRIRYVLPSMDKGDDK